MKQPTGPRGDLPARYHSVRIRRRTTAEWCLWLLWLIALVVLAEFAFTSFLEYERQAGILASVIALGWLAGGIIVELMKGLEMRDADNTARLDNETDTTEY